MPELIDRAKLLEYLAAIKPDEYVSAYGEAAVDVINHVETYMSEMPTIEAKPVRNGRWIFQKGDNKETVDGWICTNCKSGFHTKVPYFEDFKCCPMCVARISATDTNVGGKGGDDNG